MARKSFTTYKPTEVSEFDVNGRVFQLNPTVPGDILLDFLTEADAADTASMAKTLRALFSHAIVAHQLPEWNAFIRDPQNAVTLEMLAEIAGYIAEIVSGSGKTQAPLPISPMGG